MRGCLAPALKLVNCNMKGKKELYTQILQITTVKNGIGSDQVDIFQTQTSAQLILARASSLVRKGSKVTKVLFIVTLWHVMIPAPLEKIKSYLELGQ